MKRRILAVFILVGCLLALGTWSGAPNSHAALNALTLHTAPVEAANPGFSAWLHTIRTWFVKPEPAPQSRDSILDRFEQTVRAKQLLRISA